MFPYQAGKLVMVRDEGDHLNTHFRGFQAPMGMAYSVTGWPSAPRSRSGVVDVPAVTANWNHLGAPRCLLSASLQPYHGQHPDPRARRGAGRRAGGAAGAGQTDPWPGGVGREREGAARSVRDGVRAFFFTRGGSTPEERQNHE